MYNRTVSGIFSRRFVSLNSLDEAGFVEWLFFPAMLFGSRDKWWGGTGRRDTPHEGLDICMYRTSDGGTGYLGGDALVPVIFGGRVVRVIDDFLGKSVFLVHDKQSRDGDSLFTIYGHIIPRDGIHPGKTVSAGDCAGTIAGPLSKGRAVRPHLHVSTAWIPDSVPPEALDWSFLTTNDGIRIIDPLSILDMPYSVVSEE